MKKRIVLMVVCAVLLIVTVANHLYDKSREDDRALLHCMWLTVQEPYTIRLQFFDDADGILPMDKPSYFMSVYDWGAGAEPLFEGYDLWEGSWVYDGIWSLKNDVVTLKTDSGDTILGTVVGDTIRLDVGEGYLLEKYTGEE